MKDQATKIKVFRITVEMQKINTATPTSDFVSIDIPQDKGYTHVQTQNYDGTWGPTNPIAPDTKIYLCLSKYACDKIEKVLENHGIQ